AMIDDPPWCALRVRPAQGAPGYLYRLRPVFSEAERSKRRPAVSIRPLPTHSAQHPWQQKPQLPSGDRLYTVQA
ncbi:MAG: hypothetical protein WAS50_08995, partial [Nitrospira sp.]